MTHSVGEDDFYQVPEDLKKDGEVMMMPGVKSTSRSSLYLAIEKNHHKFHIFFEKNLHNHLVHHLLTVYALGSSGDRINSVYEEHAAYLEPVPPSKLKITPDTWEKLHDHNDNSMWTDWREFFDEEIRKNGVKTCLQKYVFHPIIFGRLLAGAFHPLIHLGFGVEFQLPAVISEGLAEAIMHDNNLGPIFQNNQFDKINQTDSKIEQKSIIDIIQEAIADNRFDGVITFEDDQKFRTAVEKLSPVINEYLAKWNVSATKEDVEAKQKELYQASIILYITTPRPKNAVKLDFFLMHAVTSSVSINALLKQDIFSYFQKAQLLKIHFSVTFTYWIARGRPKIYMDNFKKQYVPPYLSKPENPWMTLIEHALSIPDEHAVKVVRSLLLAERKYGDADGTIMKAAQITTAVFDNAPPEPTRASGWIYDGIGFDESWK